MLLYAFLAPLNLLISLLCYVTNPLVLLLCSEEGELPGPLRLWQPWDDSCNPSDLQDIAPQWLQFDWSRHYTEYRDTTPELAALGRDRCYCKVLDPNFTFEERVKRYLCRNLWLLRNCGYGFAFWAFGKIIEAGSVKVIDRVDDSAGARTYAKVTTEPSWRAPFLYKNDRDIVRGLLRWCVFLGWKIDYHSNKLHRAMIACRIAVRIGRR